MTVVVRQDYKLSDLQDSKKQRIIDTYPNADLVIEGLDGTLSQTHQIATMANASADNNYYGMLTALADEGALLNVEGEDTKTYSGVGAESAAYKRHTWGSTTQYDFNVSFNVCFEGFAFFF